MSMHAANPAIKAATCPKFCLEAIAICMSLVNLTMIGLCLTESQNPRSVRFIAEDRETQVCTSWTQELRRAAEKSAERLSQDQV